MKRSSSAAASSPSSSSSSSSPSSPSSSLSSCALSDVTHHHPEIPTTKRLRKTQNRDKCKNANSPNSNGGTVRRSSIYRGVTRHRWTGRFEAHLWDKTSWNNIQNKKGRQVYLGAYDCEEAAARTYDLAALKYWGPETTLNFPMETYEKEIEEMHKVSKEEYLASLRRRSSGFSRGVSKYRGVARHHHNGRWEARIGRVFGNKYLYLGTYNTQEEAAAAYDMAAIEYRGANAVTNFDISHYIDRLKKKGIFPNNSSTESEVEQPSTPAVPLPQQAAPSAAVVAAAEAEQRQEETVSSEAEWTTHEQVVEAQLPPPPPCMKSTCCTMVDVVMDPDTEAYERELTWSFCLDTGISPVSVPDIPLGNAGELPDWFDNFEAGFEENIDSIFETAVMSDENQDKTGFGVGVSGTMEGNIGNVSLLSSPSSSTTTTTTTSISCNIYSV